MTPADLPAPSPDATPPGGIAPTRATIEDVARAAGVSRAAVSKVIRDAYGVSDSMRERVSAAIADLGYRPRVAARAMRGSSRTVGVQLPRVDNSFFARILVGVFDHLEGTGYQTILAPMTHAANGKAALESLVDRQVDAIIAVAPAVSQTWLEQLGLRVPLVQIGQHDDPEHYDVVTGDDEEGSRLVMAHLFELGHRRIAHFTVDQRALSDPPADPHLARTRIYDELMTERGLPTDTRAIPLTEEAAYAETISLLSLADPPTALFAGHDELALGALRASAERGLGPEEFSVVGYDDVPIASHPLIGLTTIDQFGEEMGFLAASLVLERISGRTRPVLRQTDPVLRARRSSARISSTSATQAAGAD